MKTNRAGIDLIKEFEGLRTTAYADPVGILTIGYGHTSAAGAPKVTKGMKITAAYAEDILVIDLAKFEAEVLRKLTRLPNENQFAAMVSLCFNIGPGNFAKSSVLHYFNAGDPTTAADKFLLWNKAGGKVLAGLKRRREAERTLFRRPVVEAPAPPPPPPPDIPAAEPDDWPEPDGAMAEPPVSLWRWLMSIFKRKD